MGNQDDFISRAEAMRLLGVSDGTLYNWQKEKRVIAYPGTKKNAVVYRRSELEKLLPGQNQAA